MNKITGDEPAMPTSEPEMDSYGLPTWITTPGLTIRQEFAARAMQGLSSSAMNGTGTRELSDKYLGLISRMAVNLADALINELNKEKC